MNQLMRHLPIVAILVVAFAAAQPPTVAAGGAPTEGTGRPAPADSVPATPAPVPPAAPLLIDPSDMGLGLSMIYRRVPTTADIAALAYYDNVQHLVVELAAWPQDWADIEPLSKVLLPQGCDLIVVLPNFPPTRSQASLWNMLRQPLRIILVVDGPPVDRGLILELNSMRGLERVIATMDHPSRSGFERLQRPLSFRVLMP